MTLERENSFSLTRAENENHVCFVMLPPSRAAKAWRLSSSLKGQTDKDVFH